MKARSGCGGCFLKREDGELAALHVVEVAEDQTARRLIKMLEQSPAVEFAETEAPRRAL